MGDDANASVCEMGGARKSTLVTVDAAWHPGQLRPLSKRGTTIGEINHSILQYTLVFFSSTRMYFNAKTLLATAMTRRNLSLYFAVNHMRLSATVSARENPNESSG